MADRPGDVVFLGDSLISGGNWTEIIRHRCPETVLSLQSYLPVATEHAAFIRLLNQALAQIAAGAGATYLDLFAAVDGSLDIRFTPDGVHLLPAASDVWWTAIEPLVASRPAAPTGPGGRYWAGDSTD